MQKMKSSPWWELFYISSLFVHDIIIPEVVNFAKKALLLSSIIV
jgi:hypothetical protein